MNKLVSKLTNKLAHDTINIFIMYIAIISRIDSFTDRIEWNSHFRIFMNYHMYISAIMEFAVINGNQHKIK